MSNGLVYIMTNPCLDGWVKIGMTERDDIEDRLKELNTPTNIPLTFRCYATYEVDNPLQVEKRIHNIIDRIDNSLHARETLGNGRIREREFFKMSPETAYGLLVDVANLRGDIDKLKLYAPTAAQIQEQDVQDSRTNKRSNNSFKLLNISVGEKISFLYDDEITATVADDKNQVTYEGEVYSVSKLAGKLLIEKHGWSENASVNGWMYFTKDGISLSDLRDKIEAAE